LSIFQTVNGTDNLYHKLLKKTMATENFRCIFFDYNSFEVLRMKSFLELKKDDVYESRRTVAISKQKALRRLSGGFFVDGGKFIKKWQEFF